MMRVLREGRAAERVVRVEALGAARVVVWVG
jgi:hypothetical protein